MMRAARTLTFGQRAEDYHRWRPSYPADAVDWLAPPAPARVADVGAGTGRMTSLLLSRGLIVEAVEPDPRMLAVLAAHNPDARCHDSDATAIPVADSSLAAVLVADAWHWMPAAETMAEVRRVLKPGGWLGLIWNVTAEPVEPWELGLADAPDTYDRTTKATDEGISERLPAARADELEFAQFDWAWDLTPEHRAASLATTSTAIAMEPAEREEFLEASRSEWQGVCDSASATSMPLRQQASCTRWTPNP